MGRDTAIEWADDTVNVYMGCTKVSPACANCYAETNSAVRVMEARIGEALLPPVAPGTLVGTRKLKMWGRDGFRYETVGWERELRALNRKAKGERVEYEGYVHADMFPHWERPRVFINSLSDICEDWRGPVYRLEDGKPVLVAQSLDDVRARFFRVAEECTELDLLLLTKRPANILEFCPAHWIVDAWPAHVVVGTTVEDQTRADKRIPHLLRVPAKVRFLSMEPLLEQIERLPLDDINWVIVGGESGTNARPMHPDWVRSIRDQCQDAGVSFFFKQWGEWHPVRGK